jgi:hypothetical protein
MCKRLLKRILCQLCLLNERIKRFFFTERAALFYAQWLAEQEGPHVKQIGCIASTLRAGQ